MTLSRKLFATGAALAAATALAGCMTGGGTTTPVEAAVEGSWISTDGVAVSTFSGGVFETKATDTGNQLADGSYRMADAQSVQITVVSKIRKTTTNVDCTLANPSQLNCTSSSGSNFVLTRRA